MANCLIQSRWLIRMRAGTCVPQSLSQGAALENWPTEHVPGAGKTALITGSSGGIGFYVARILARCGYTIIIPVVRQPETLHRHVSMPCSCADGIFDAPNGHSLRPCPFEALVSWLRSAQTSRKMRKARKKESCANLQRLGSSFPQRPSTSPHLNRRAC